MNKTYDIVFGKTQGQALDYANKWNIKEQPYGCNQVVLATSDLVLESLNPEEVRIYFADAPSEKMIKNLEAWSNSRKRTLSTVVVHPEIEV